MTEMTETEALSKLMAYCANAEHCRAELTEKMQRWGLAYDAMNQTDYPSFGNWIRQGATTFWEYYDGQSSHNHPFLGNALTWFYRTCAGVYADENDPGYRHLIIRPTLADKLERVHYAKQTPYGRASSEVSHNASTVTIKAEVPVGVHATIYIPSNSDEQPTVNGKKVDIPSYIVKEGDVVAVRENRAKNKYFEQVKGAKAGNVPKWIESDLEKLEGKVLALPKREDIDSQIAEHMIVELYSK